MIEGITFPPIPVTPISVAGVTTQIGGAGSVTTPADVARLRAALNITDVKDSAVIMGTTSGIGVNGVETDKSMGMAIIDSLDNAHKAYNAQLSSVQDTFTKSQATNTPISSGELIAMQFTVFQASFITQVASKVVDSIKTGIETLEKAQ
ncbi:MAG: hypothetical protein HQL01_09765 [Nitrospirae bacterium]|nr:hypothetical protein [Nitrospirota bacterium]